MGLVTVNTGSCPGLLTPTAVMKHLDAWPFLRKCFNTIPVFMHTCCRYIHPTLQHMQVNSLGSAIPSTLGSTDCLEPLLQI